MNCQKLITDFLDDYVAGTLAPAVLAEFEVHLRTCAARPAYLDSYRKTVALARTAATSEETAPPAELIEAILKATSRPSSDGV